MSQGLLDDMPLDDSNIAVKKTKYVETKLFNNNFGFSTNLEQTRDY